MWHYTSVSRRELRAIEKELERKGMKLVYDGDDYLKREFPLTHEKKAAVFHINKDGRPITPTIVVRRKFTAYELLHELEHARQFHSIGRKAFEGLGRYKAELHVYTQLITKHLHRLSEEEVAHATRYIIKKWHDKRMGRDS